MDENTPLNRRRLPDTEYYYHYTYFNNLDSIKKLGLTSHAVHKMEKVYQNLEFYKRDDRVFFLTEEKDCLYHVLDWNYPRFAHSPELEAKGKMMALRVRRDLLDKEKLYHDPGYAENESSVFRPKDWKIYSFSSSCTISASELEICDYARKFFAEYKSISWIPLMQATTFTQLRAAKFARS